MKVSKKITALQLEIGDKKGEKWDSAVGSLTSYRQSPISNLQSPISTL